MIHFEDLINWTIDFAFNARITASATGFVLEDWSRIVLVTL